MINLLYIIWFILFMILYLDYYYTYVPVEKIPVEDDSKEFISYKEHKFNPLNGLKNNLIGVQVESDKMAFYEEEYIKDNIARQLSHYILEKYEVDRYSQEWEPTIIHKMDLYIFDRNEIAKIFDIKLYNMV